MNYSMRTPQEYEDLIRQLTENIQRARTYKTEVEGRKQVIQDEIQLLKQLVKDATAPFYKSEGVNVIFRQHNMPLFTYQEMLTPQENKTAYLKQLQILSNEKLTNIITTSNREIPRKEDNLRSRLRYKLVERDDYLRVLEEHKLMKEQLSVSPYKLFEINQELQDQLEELKCDYQLLKLRTEQNESQSTGTSSQDSLVENVLSKCNKRCPNCCYWNKKHDHDDKSNGHQDPKNSDQDEDDEDNNDDQGSNHKRKHLKKRTQKQNYKQGQGYKIACNQSNCQREGDRLSDFEVVSSENNSSKSVDTLHIPQDRFKFDVQDPSETIAALNIDDQHIIQEDRSSLNSSLQKYQRSITKATSKHHENLTDANLINQSLEEDGDFVTKNKDRTLVSQEQNAISTKDRLMKLVYFILNYFWDLKYLFLFFGIWMIVFMCLISSISSLNVNDFFRDHPLWVQHLIRILVSSKGDDQQPDVSKLSHDNSNEANIEQQNFKCLVVIWGIYILNTFLFFIMMLNFFISLTNSIHEKYMMYYYSPSKETSEEWSKIRENAARSIDQTYMQMIIQDNIAKAKPDFGKLKTQEKMIMAQNILSQKYIEMEVYNKQARDEFSEIMSDIKEISFKTK